MQTIGIMGAMPEEIEAILPQLRERSERTIGGRIYYTGEWHNKKLVLVFSRWGKVAAASTVTTLIHEFGIEALIFTGVAGAIDSRLNPGDIVIAEKLVQHDLDARPLMERHEIPLLNKTWIETDPFWREQLQLAVASVLEQKNLRQLISEEDRNLFQLHSPRYYAGEIASGDQFFSLEEQKNALKARLPEVLCVEMEGAAVAQVCYEHDLPFIVLRTISDSADERSVIDFPLFVGRVARIYSLAILNQLFSL